MKMRDIIIQFIPEQFRYLANNGLTISVDFLWLGSLCRFMWPKSRKIISELFDEDFSGFNIIGINKKA